jgi:hypothetical protein
VPMLLARAVPKNSNILINNINLMYMVFIPEANELLKILYVIPAQRGKQARREAAAHKAGIQLNQPAGCRIKSGMTNFYRCW